MRKWIVPILFLALPFAFLAPGLIWKSQLLFFLICPIFIIAINLKNVWIKTFLLYAAAWQIIIFLMSFNDPSHNAGAGLSILLSLMAGALIFKFISEGDLPDGKWLMVIRIAVIIQILIAIPQHFGFSAVMYLVGMLTPVVQKQPLHLVGTLGNRNYLSIFVAASLPFFIGWMTFKVRGFSINPILIGIMIFLFFCFSPATIAAIAGMLFIFSYDLSAAKKALFLAIGAGLGIGYTAFYIAGAGTHYMYGQGSHLWEFQALPGQLKELWTTGNLVVDPRQGDLGRFGMILSAFSQLIRSWSFAILGYGPAASWGRNYPVHCEYMSMWFQFGLIGLGLMMGYIVTTWRYLTKEKNRIFLGSFLIILIDMAGNFSLEVATTAFMIIVITALIERKRIHG